MRNGTSLAVVGAGIAGLTLAGALQDAAADVTVLERKDGLRDSGAGISSLWPNALAALDTLGVGDLVRSLGVGIASGGQIKADGRHGPRLTRRSFEAALGEGLVCVERGVLVRALADRLEPGVLLTGCAVSGYEQNVSGVTLLTGSERLGPFDIVLGADGASSAIAAQLAGPLKISYSGYLAWRGIAEIAPQSAQDVSMCVAGGHEFGWMPVSAGRTYWFATAWLEAGHEFGQGHEDYLARTFQSWPEPIPHLLGATPVAQLVCNDISDRTPARRWVDRRVAVAGDAAHPMRPHLGQGGCQAVEDAAVLATCFNSQSDPLQALATYESLRRRRAEMVVRLSRRSGFTRPPTRRTRLTERVASLVPAIPVGLALRLIAPIASYKAGTRAVSRV